MPPSTCWISDARERLGRAGWMTIPVPTYILVPDTGNPSPLFVKGSLKRELNWDTEMKRSSWIIGLALNPTTNVLVRNRGRETMETELKATQTHKKLRCSHKSQKLATKRGWKGQGSASPPESLEATWTCWLLHLITWPLEPWENEERWLEATQRGVICDSSHGKLREMCCN